jgi:xylulose-5-phosphate/fructose-6-phosphate phosphoketolase
MLILRSPKGWTGVKELDGKPVEGSFRAHQVPVADVKKNPEHLQLVEDWLRSYRPEELFDEHGAPQADILACCPQGERRMSCNPHAFGGRLRRLLYCPPLAVRGRIREINEASRRKDRSKFSPNISPRSSSESVSSASSPDELMSNKLGGIFEAPPA